ncbi:MAG: hypothetical protein A2038_08270 [Deltaproteobacteria bacterium GWA2_57_13]|nr:MAG: hypothetical protein A2038_08270 [Deltaproteobacteria bacterium GWA2_57_13]
MLRGQAAEMGDEGLVALARKGGNKAFEVLVERYKQKAYRIAFHFTRDREEAKDLSQEAFLRAFTNMKGFDRQSSFYTWFYRMLVNLCVDYQRRRKRVAWESINEKADKISETNGMTGAAVEAKIPWWKGVFLSYRSWSVPALATALVLILALTLTFRKRLWMPTDLPPDEEAPLEILPIAENLEFFKAMDLLDSLDLLEAGGGPGSGSA